MDKSSYDCGAADAYYGRKRNPHKKVAGTKIYELTEKELGQYHKGYEEETDRKEW